MLGKNGLKILLMAKVHDSVSKNLWISTYVDNLKSNEIGIVLKCVICQKTYLRAEEVNIWNVTASW